MGNQGKRDGDYIKTAFSILREVTFTLKTAPFVYTFMYIVFYMLYVYVGDAYLAAIERYLYVSPIVIATLLYLSYTLRLCNWYRFQCLLPLLPQALGLVDKYVYAFGEASATALVSMVAAMFVASLVNVILVFNR